MKTAIYFHLMLPYLKLTLLQYEKTYLLLRRAVMKNLPEKLEELDKVYQDTISTPNTPQKPNMGHLEGIEITPQSIFP